jgi:hypothetical protein
LDFPVLYGVLADIEATCPQFKKRFLKQNAQQVCGQIDADLSGSRAEFFVSDTLVQALEKHPKGVGLGMYLKNIGFLWKAITYKEVSNVERIQLAWRTLCFIVYSHRHVLSSQYYSTNSKDSTVNFIPQASKEATIQLTVAFIFSMCIMVTVFTQ